MGSRGRARVGSRWAQTQGGAREGGAGVGPGTGVGGSRGEAARDGWELGTQLPPHRVRSAGYPNEAAAEVVLTTLREWLEQHKDKVRPGPSQEDRTGVGGGAHPGPADQPHQSRAECRVHGVQALPLLSVSPLLYSGLFPPLQPGHRVVREGNSTPHHEPLLQPEL